jgi:hypothetical protein
MYIYKTVGFKIFKAVTIQMMFFWVMSACEPDFGAEDGESVLLRNVRLCQSIHTVT